MLTPDAGGYDADDVAVIEAIVALPRGRLRRGADRQGRVQGLPLRRGSRGADHRARQEALHLPGAAEEAREGLARDLPARHAASSSRSWRASRAPRAQSEQREQGPASIGLLAFPKAASNAMLVSGARVGERQAADGRRARRSPTSTRRSSWSRTSTRPPPPAAGHRRPRRLVHRRQPLRPARPRARLRVERDVGRPGQHRHVRGPRPAASDDDALRLPRPVPADGGARARSTRGSRRRATSTPAGTRDAARAAHEARASSPAAATVARQAGRVHQLRSTYFHEIDSRASASCDFNDPAQIRSAAGLPARREQDRLHVQLVLRRRRSTSPTSTPAPTRVRAEGRRPRLPGRAAQLRVAGLEPRRWHGALHAVRPAPAGGRPDVPRVSWNNKQAQGLPRRRRQRVLVRLPLAAARGPAQAG